MTVRPAHLPDFERPPLKEVALGVQFKTLDRFRTPHIGPLWDVFRSAFPQFRELPPLEPTFETFGPEKSGVKVRLRELPNPPIPRLWFVNDGERELVQFQTDRFIHNWRKTGEATDYPRYEAIRERFEAEINDINQFLVAHDLGCIQPNQAEITYVNLIPSDSEDDQVNLWKMMRFWQVGEPALAEKLEHARVNLRFLIRDDQGIPVGRLFANAEPVRTNEDKTSMRLTLVARGPVEDTVASTLEFLDLGRARLVSGFADLTTDEMHKQWGRKQ